MENWRPRDHFEVEHEEKMALLPLSQAVVLHAVPKILVIVLVGVVQVSLNASIVTKTYSGLIVQVRIVLKGGMNAHKILPGVVKA